MSDLFHVIDDAAAILRGKSGVWRQAKVYRFGLEDHLFAGYGTGFVRLYADHGTSRPDTFLDRLHGVEFTSDKLGRLMLTGAANG